MIFSLNSFRNNGQTHRMASLSRRWLVQKGFGWLKQTGPLRQMKLRGLEKVDWLFVFSCAAHNLIRLPRLIAQPPEMLQESKNTSFSAVGHLCDRGGKTTVILYENVFAKVKVPYSHLPTCFDARRIDVSTAPLIVP